MFNRNRKASGDRMLLAGYILGALMMCSCEEDNKPMKSVDLRYIAQDQYELEAADPAPIALQVKSTDPWEVFNKNKGWCTITPEQGIANELYDVEVMYAPNTELDDRVDTVFIKSDYWVGKRIHILQKGTAFLSLEDDEDFVLSETPDTRTFRVKSNQNWSSAVTGGAEWLTVISGETGSLDGDVTVAVIENKGEKRYGTVSIYDRHNVERALVRVIQEGLQLDPEDTNYQINHEQQQLIIPVISNAEWTVVKDDDDIEWYSFGQSSFDGSASLVINFDENAGSVVRKASFTISTKQVEGITPVTKNIVVKQANNPVPLHYEFDETERSKWGGAPAFNGDATFTGNLRMTRDGFAPGYYSFRIKSMSEDAMSVLFFTYGAKEIRWHLNAATKKTAHSTAPWSMANEIQQSFDPTVPHTISLNLTDAGNGLTRIEWILDDEVVYTYINEENFALPWPSNAFVYLGTSAGTVVYDWWEYTAPIDWGE